MASASTTIATAIKYPEILKVVIYNNHTSLEWFGTCWLDMLPGADAAKAKDLANVILNPRKPNANKISDYCTQAKYKTLDFNNGQPTDG